MIDRLIYKLLADKLGDAYPVYPAFAIPDDQAAPYCVYEIVSDNDAERLLAGNQSDVRDATVNVHVVALSADDLDAIEKLIDAALIVDHKQVEDNVVLTANIASRARTAGVLDDGSETLIYQTSAAAEIMYRRSENG